MRVERNTELPAASCMQHDQLQTSCCTCYCIPVKRFCCESCNFWNGSITFETGRGWWWSLLHVNTVELQQFKNQQFHLLCEK